MRVGITHSKKRCEQQEGIVMLLILLLVLMFTGLGLMAMRHTRGELRTTGAYLDNLQAAALAEAAIIMTAADMRLYWDYGCKNLSDPDNPNNDIDYEYQYRNFYSGSPDRQMSFSPAFQGGDPDNCTAGTGQLPDPRLNGQLPLAITESLSFPRASVTVTHKPYECAYVMEGDSGETDRTFDYYWITVEAEADYGEPSNAPLVSLGHAKARARMYLARLPRVTNCP